MPRDPQILVFVGIKHAVVALDQRTGTPVWRTALHSGDYVTLLWDGESLFAANAGEVWCLDPNTGAVRWHNELKGMGRGFTSLASSRLPGMQSTTDLAAAKRWRDLHDAETAGTA